MPGVYVYVFGSPEVLASVVMYVGSGRGGGRGINRSRGAYVCRSAERLR